MGQPLANERGGAGGNREVPPSTSASGRRGLVGETWFPPRERGKAERRSCCRPLEVGELDVLDLADRQLQEARAGDLEDLRVARGQEAVGALAARLVLHPLPRNRFGYLAGGLFC